MKFLTSVIAPLLLAQGAVGFVPSSKHQPKLATPKTALEAEAKRGGIIAEATAAASTCLVGLALLAGPAAFASGVDVISPSVAGGSSIHVAEIEQFTLPSYDASKGKSLIDISADVETVNKKTLQQAKARREAEDKSAEKLAADELRRAEKEGGSLLDSMIGNAEKEKKAAVAAEIAESRANRWKTF